MIWVLLPPSPPPSTPQVGAMTTELSPQLRASATNDAREAAVDDAKATADTLAKVRGGGGGGGACLLERFVFSPAWRFTWGACTHFSHAALHLNLLKGWGRADPPGGPPAPHAAPPPLLHAE